MLRYTEETMQRCSSRLQACRNESGFSLTEFMICSLILLLVAAAASTLLAQIQRSGSYRTEVQSVLENTRIVMDTVERIIRQAGNDPYRAGFPGVTIISATEARIRSDLTGSAEASGFPDKGDPDGDTDDAGEDVTIRYNANGGSVELVSNGGSAQPIANYISGFQMQYLDAAGIVTSAGADVRKIRISITGATRLADLQTGQVFSLQVASDVQLATRL